MPAQIKATVSQTSLSASQGQARSHAVPVDRPVEKGGEDQGPMGGELMLIGLGGCFMSNLLAAAKAREVPATNMSVDVIGLVADAPTRFSEIELRVSGDIQDRGIFIKLVTIAERGCIVANTLRDAVKLTVTLT
jgi:putative redox protein